jgi:hypothetical protein
MDSTEPTADGNPTDLLSLLPALATRSQQMAALEAERSKLQGAMGATLTALVSSHKSGSRPASGVQSDAAKGTGNLEYANILDGAKAMADRAGAFARAKGVPAPAGDHQPEVLMRNR